MWRAAGARRLVEPFCGGLSMSLGLEPTHAHLNDMNPHLINFYRWLQQGWQHDASDDILNTAENYYALREEFNARLTHETLDDAKRFYALNRMSFKGLFRVNRRGLFNTPYGHNQTKHTIIGCPNYTVYQHLMASWTFTAGSYADLTLHSDDFVYADPPYDTEFTAYTDTKFTFEEQVAVASWAAKHTGPVVLCNQATPRIVTLYAGLGFTLFYANRKERMHTKRHTSVPEIIATRNIPHPDDSRLF
jgi:DNA adenine methylase